MPYRMLTPQYILALCLMAMCFTVGVWDIWAQATQRPEATVSNLVGTWSMQYPMLPLALGVLLGHLFWPRSVNPL